MPAFDRNAGSFVTIRTLGIILATGSVLMCAAPASAQIPIPIPNFRFDVHPGSGYYSRHHRGSSTTRRGAEKQGDSVPNPSTTAPPTQTAGGQTPAASQVPPPSAPAPSPPPPAGMPGAPAHSEAQRGPDFEPSK